MWLEEALRLSKSIFEGWEKERLLARGPDKSSGKSVASQGSATGETLPGWPPLIAQEEFVRVVPTVSLEFLSSTWVPRVVNRAPWTTPHMGSLCSSSRPGYVHGTRPLRTQTWSPKAQLSSIYKELKKEEYNR